MVLLIDNYDSFSYNLFQYVGEINTDIKVIRNDEMNIKQIKDLNPTHIIISPGPGFPKDAGVCEQVIKEFSKTIPILGVCLGHQAICEVYGASIVHAEQLVHGKKDNIYIANGSEIFRGQSPIIEAARYHSLVADKNTMPDELLVIAEDKNGEIMGVKHRDYDVFGVQFHPESVMTSSGKAIIANFLNIGGVNNDN